MTVQQARIIVNPVAGASTTYRKWPKISDLLKHIGLAFEFHYTEGVGHAIELAREATASGCPLLVAVGGDGTVNEVANGMMLSPELAGTSIGVISTGTGGDFIRSAGIHKDYIKACSSLTGSKRKQIDVGIIEYNKNGQPQKRFFINSAGIGFDAAAVEATNHLPKFLGGTIPYVMGLVKSLVGYKNKNVTLAMGGKEETRRVLSVVAANGCYFGGGMRVAPDADIEDGLLDIITVGDVGKLELLKVFPTIYKGTHVHHPKVSTGKATSISIKSDEKFMVQADGEYLGEGPVSISIMPAALNMAV